MPVSRIEEKLTLRARLLTAIGWLRRAAAGLLVITVAIVAAVWAVVVIARAWRPLPADWRLQVAVITAVATVPLWLVDLVDWIVVELCPQLQPGDHLFGFRNPGAYLGMVERPLFLGALLAGQPGFIAVWFVFKGITGWRTGGTDVRAGRRFHLLLLNNAVLLGGVALGWLLWNHLGLPVPVAKP